MKRREFHDERFGNSVVGRTCSESAVAIELTPLPELCERLEDRQRFLLRRGLARLGLLIHSAVTHDRRNRPQLARLQKSFAAFREQFTAHLREETETIFPFIRQLESSAVGKTHARRSLQTLTARLERQHFEADEAFAEVCALAGDGCARTLRDNLASFERNLHEQIYEENRVLFPRARAVSRA